MAQLLFRFSRHKFFLKFHNHGKYKDQTFLIRELYIYRKQNILESAKHISVGSPYRPEFEHMEIPDPDCRRRPLKDGSFYFLRVPRDQAGMSDVSLLDGYRVVDLHAPFNWFDFSEVRFNQKFGYVTRRRRYFLSAKPTNMGNNFAVLDKNFEQLYEDREMKAEAIKIYKQKYELFKKVTARKARLQQQIHEIELEYNEKIFPLERRLDELDPHCNLQGSVDTECEEHIRENIRRIRMDL